MNPFPSPSAKSKSEFESKTSSIHAETTTQASYDLGEIKTDVQWLSQKAGIDEITALRIAILEWQNRPATRLGDNFADEETTSLQSAGGVDDLRASLAGPAFTGTLRRNAGNGDSEFVSEENRRLRLRHLYLEERSHILKTARKLLTLSLHNAALGSSALHQPSDKDRLPLSALGAEIFKDKAAKTGQFLQDCINAIRKRLDEFLADGGWLGADGSSEDVEASWKTTLIEEVVHILQMLFMQLQASEEVSDADLLLSWLRLMADFSFLEPLQVVCRIINLAAYLRFSC